MLLSAGEGGAPLPLGLADALAIAALIAGLGGLGLVVWVWYLFDSHVARPVERLSGAILTGAMPADGEGRYLADLAPAARAASRRAAGARRAKPEGGKGARETEMLEHILSDIGAGAVLSGADGRVLFFNAAAAQLLPGLALDRKLRRFLRGGLDAAEARIAEGAEASDVALIGADGARLSGASGGWQVRPPCWPSCARRAASRFRRAPLEALRRHAATLTPLLDHLDAPLLPEPRRAICTEARGMAAARAIWMRR